jgi:hypothetical protein
MCSAQRIQIHDRSQSKLLRRRKSGLMKDSTTFVSSLAPPLRLQIRYIYREKERSLSYVGQLPRRKLMAPVVTAQGPFLKSGEGAKNMWGTYLESKADLGVVVKTASSWIQRHSCAFLRAPLRLLVVTFM